MIRKDEADWYLANANLVVHCSFCRRQEHVRAGALTREEIAQVAAHFRWRCTACNRKWIEMVAVVEGAAAVEKVLSVKEDLS